MDIFTPLIHSLTELIGGFDHLIYALLVFAIIDYITGLMSALLLHRFTVQIAIRGIYKKILIFLLVIISHILDTNILFTENVLRTAVIFFYLCTEGTSILKNVRIIGLPIPSKLKEIFRNLENDKQP